MHAKFPPSGADRWLKCGYSVKMAEYFPSKETPASKEGTRQHAIAAFHLENGTESNAPGLRTYLSTVRDCANDGRLFVEKKVDIVPGHCWGTSDAVVVGEDWISVLDLKWGTSLVTAIGNPQLKLYAIGALREFLPDIADAVVCLTIVQPNAKGWPVKRWATTAKKLFEFIPVVEAAIEEGLKADPKAVTGNHCYWCPAKLHCHAYLVGGNNKKVS